MDWDDITDFGWSVLVFIFVQASFFGLVLGAIYLAGWEEAPEGMGFVGFLVICFGFLVSFKVSGIAFEHGAPFENDGPLGVIGAIAGILLIIAAIAAILLAALAYLVSIAVGAMVLIVIGIAFSSR